MMTFGSWWRSILAVAVVFSMGAFVYRPAAPPAANRKAVVVELFTSEGCSSCPPADELLVRLRQMQSMNGAEIISLGFHVDYWNDLGWPDRFSTKAYTQRQEDYALKFRRSGPYTPQMVVDGIQEFVGNDARRAKEVIVQETAQPAQVVVEVSLPAPGTLLVRAHASGEDAAGDVMLAVTEDDLTTRVGAGENGGRVLRHAAVVRDFRRVGKLAHGGFLGEVPVKLAKDWKPKDLRLVVFVQAASGGIQGAASMPWDSLTGAR